MAILLNKFFCFQIGNGSLGGILKYFKQPVNTTLFDGDQLLLKCNPVLDLNSPTKYRIKHKWYRDGRLIAYNSNTVNFLVLKNTIKKIIMIFGEFFRFFTKTAPWKSKQRIRATRESTNASPDTARSRSSLARHLLM